MNGKWRRFVLVLKQKGRITPAALLLQVQVAVSCCRTCSISKQVQDLTWHLAILTFLPSVCVASLWWVHKTQNESLLIHLALAPASSIVSSGCSGQLGAPSQPGGTKGMAAFVPRLGVARLFEIVRIVGYDTTFSKALRSLTNKAWEHV